MEEFANWGCKLLKDFFSLIFAQKDVKCIKYN